MSIFKQLRLGLFSDDKPDSNTVEERGNTPLTLPSPPPDDDPSWDERAEAQELAADDARESAADIPPEDVQKTVDAWLRMIARDDPYYSAGL